MVQSQDITALFYSMELLQSLLKMFRKHYLFRYFYVLEQKRNYFVYFAKILLPERLGTFFSPGLRNTKNENENKMKRIKLI